MYWYVGAKTATNPTTASATLMAVWLSGCNVQLGVGVWLAVCQEWSQQLAPWNNFHLSQCQEGNHCSDVCYCVPWTWQVLIISTVAAAMSQAHAVTHSGDNVCDQHLGCLSFSATSYLCLDSVDRIQFLLPPFVQVFWIPHCFVNL